MKTDLYTEKLFCVALLVSGTDVAAKVLADYIMLRDSKELDSWLESISSESNRESKSFEIPIKIR